MADHFQRRTPPETPEEWAYLWEAARKAEAGWPVVAPALAVFSNWKVIAVGISIAFLANGKDILALMGLT